MAFIGLRYPRYCLVNVEQNPDGTETETLGVGKVMGKIISANETINYETQYQYADDGVAETISTFVDGALGIQVADLIHGVKSDLLGRTVNANGELVSNANDEAPYARVAYIVPSIRNKKKVWKACCYLRVQFSPTGRELQTRGQNVTMAGETINGAILRNQNGDWLLEKEFDTLAGAMDWLAEKTNMPTGPAPELSLETYPADGTSGVATDIEIALSFSNPINHASAAILVGSTGAAVPVTVAFNGDKTVLTVTPKMALSAGTEYIVVVSGVRDAYAQKLDDTTIKFTTA